MHNELARRNPPRPQKAAYSMDTPSNYTETLEKTVRDLLKRQEDLVRTAFTDQLTGLGNRGGFARSLEELWEQDTPVTMAYIDIDNLKHCNDVFGHDEGNRYILQVSLYLKLYMEVDEAAFRLGGRRVRHPIYDCDRGRPCRTSGTLPNGTARKQRFQDASLV